MANSVDPDQTAPIGTVCSGSTLFASTLNLSIMLDIYLQQTTSADNIFRCIFFLGALRVKILIWVHCASMANSVDPDQTAPMGAVCSGSNGSSLFWVQTFASILNLSIMLDIYLQQTTSADNIFRWLFFYLAL